MTADGRYADRLAALVSDRLEAIGHPDVRPPSPDEYRIGSHWIPENSYDFSVAIDIGYTSVELRSQFLGPSGHLPWEADPAVVADAIAAHVAAAVADRTAKANYEAAMTTIRAKLKRDRIDLDIASVRFSPANLYQPPELANHPIWLRATVLDDLLLPYVEIMRGRPRAICHQLKTHGRKEAIRRAIRERLAAQGAALEIERAAEHALAASGRELREVVGSMLAARRPYNGNGMRVVLFGERPGPEVSVLARDGRIRIEAHIDVLTWRWDRGISLRATLPATAITALAGRPLGMLVGHPMLPPDVVIEEVEDRGSNMIQIDTRFDVRPISNSETGGPWTSRTGADLGNHPG